MTTTSLATIVDAPQLRGADISKHVGHEVEIIWVRHGAPVMSSGVLTSYNSASGNLIVKKGAHIQNIAKGYTRKITCKKPSAHRRKS